MEILLRKINGVEVRQSLFERGRDLATVKLRTADGTHAGLSRVGRYFDWKSMRAGASAESVACARPSGRPGMRTRTAPETSVRSQPS